MQIAKLEPCYQPQERCLLPLVQIAKLEPCYQPAYKRGLRVGGEEREPRGLRVEGEDREPWDPRRESLTFERE